MSAKNNSRGNLHYMSSVIKKLGDKLRGPALAAGVMYAMLGTMPALPDGSAHTQAIKLEVDNIMRSKSPGQYGMSALQGQLHSQALDFADRAYYGDRKEIIQDFARAADNYETGNAASATPNYRNAKTNGAGGRGTKRVRRKKPKRRRNRTLRR